MAKGSAGIADLPQGASPVVRVIDEFIPQPERPVTSTTQNIVFKLVNKSRGDVYLPLYAQNIIKKRDGDGNPIYDTIRVLKGVYTIWESEQKDIKMDAKMLSKSRRSLKFEFGGRDNVALVKSDDSIVLEALRILPHNTGVEGHDKGSRFAFYEIDTQKQAEIEAKKRQNKRKAVRLAEEQSFEKLKKHAHYLRIRLFDEYGTPKVEKALRNEYEDYADLNADKFLASVGSTEVEVAFLISKAIAEAKLDISTHQGSAYWATGAFICKIPSNQRAHDYLIEYAMNPINVDSKTFREQLEAIVT